MTVWGIFLFMTVAAIGASAVDVTHFFAARTQLQVAADLAAHGALWRGNRGTASATAAKEAAVELVEFGMPAASYGEVLEGADILFGTFDRASDTFSVDPSSRSAVLVTTGRQEEGDNPVGTFLFRMAGVEQIYVGASAVAETYNPPCLDVGLTAQGVIDIQSNSTFFRKICIHSNAHVSLNSGNSFAAGTTVSMPDTDDLVLPSSGLSQNPGLADALLEDEIDIRLLRRITATAADPLEQAILTPEDPDRPDYLTSTAVRNLGTGGSVSYLPSDFGAGQVHRRTCSSSGGTITLSGGVYSRFVLLTNCQIQISGKVDLQNVVLFTTNTDPTSVKVNSGGGSETGLWLGRPDNCQPGGAAQIITRGGFRNSAKLTIDGGQIVALGDVNFSAQATGLGASIVAGGRIDGSSNLSFSGCDIGRGTGENFAGLYIRIVR